MPSLDDILNSGTLLRAAHGNKPTGMEPPSALPDADPSASDEEDKQIWHFSHNFANQLNRINRLTCKVQSMNFMAMTVCDDVLWGPIQIDIHGNTVDLPLTRQFLALSEYLDGGFVAAGTNSLWPLEARIDKGFQHVFCYDLGPPGTSSTPQQVNTSIFQDKNFMPNPVDSHLPVDGTVGKDSICTIALANLYIVVVVSMVCCKLRYDFEPGGILGAGRMYPLIYTMSNQSLDKINAEIRINRPATLPPGHDMMDGEEMNHEISAEFFGDLNNTSGLPVTWKETFSHYWIDPPPGPYVMIDPAKPKRTISDAVVNNRIFTDVPPMKIQDRIYTDLLDFEKLSSQGEFDNLHLAPKMKAPAATRASFPNDSSLLNIAMAPFCIHDCLHTHTRWGNGSFAQPDHIKGWEGFKPYTKIGAPLVPPNQKITFDMLNSHAFKYKCEIKPTGNIHVDGGQWQIVFHHGSAYALDISSKGKAAKQLLAAGLAAGGEQIISGHGSWAMFYYMLRYGRGVSHVVERVQVIDMTKARS